MGLISRVSSRTYREKMSNIPPKTENVLNPNIPSHLCPKYHNYIEQFRDQPNIADKISRILEIILKKVDNIENKVTDKSWEIDSKVNKETKKPMAIYFHNQ